MRTPTPLLALLFCCLAAAGTHAQTRSLVRVIYADSLVSRLQGEMQLRELIGRVRLEQENVVITCDRALQNIDRNTVDLDGNVVITQDTLVLRSRRGTYDGNTRTARTRDGIEIRDGHVTLRAESGWYETDDKVAEFRSRVHVRDTSATITAGALRYDRDSARATAWENVLVRFRTERAVITGDSVIHYTDRRHSFFPVSPRLWQIDTTVVRRDSLTGRADSIRLDTLFMAARRMEAYRDSTNRFLALGAVELVRGDLSARGDEARFLRNDSLLVLRTEPIVWYEQNQLTGDSIAVTLADNRVQSTHVTGNGFSASQSKPSESDTLAPPGRWDQTSGKSIHIRFLDDRAERIVVDGTATSLYYLWDGRALNGVRRESGDRIIIDFDDDGKAAEIRTLGGVEGTYYPEKYVTGREAEYDLEGMRWRDDRPVMQQLPPDTPIF